MSDWLVDNLATILILCILLVLVFFAIRSVLKNKGRCGTDGCENCMGCREGRSRSKKNRD